jgi:hypothetical protein
MKSSYSHATQETSFAKIIIIIIIDCKKLEPQPQGSKKWKVHLPLQILDG